MDYRILMPEQAIRQFAMGYPAARDSLQADKLLFQDDLKLVLYKALRELLEGGDKDFDTLRSYIGEEQERIWPLASTLAASFHHYGLNCPELVKSWNQGSSISVLKGLDSENEPWQRKLWKRIFHEKAPYTHLSKILSAIEDSDEAYDAEPGAKAGRLILFGSAFLSERGLKFFKQLSKNLDVHHFILSPVGNSKEVQSMFLRNNARLALGVNTLIDTLKPDNLQECTDATESERSLLGRLRHALHSDKPFDSSIQKDESLDVHNVPGVLRSVEVLKECILAALHEDKTLVPSQIAVLAPDINLYAPHIETVFPLYNSDGSFGAEYLPYHLVDRPYRSDSPFNNALDSLLEIPGSRFGRDMLLKLFDNPCFAPAAAGSGRSSAWSTLVELLHIRWGSTEEHRRSQNAIDAERGSWDYGFKRILASYYYDEGDNPDILPLPGLTDTLAEDAGYLMHSIYQLDEQLRNLNQKEKTLQEWTLHWEKLVDQWLHVHKNAAILSEDQKEYDLLKRVFRDLLALSDDVDKLSDFENDKLPWTVFRSLLEEFREKRFRRHGFFPSKGITCGSLKTTRAIPFRRIYVLGLDEGAWPQRERLAGFDLRESLPRVIDLSSESVDRFSLVELLFSASDHVSLFYTGRDPERGEALAPAGPLSELLDYMGSDSGKLIERHPLHPLLHALPQVAKSQQDGEHPATQDGIENESLNWHELFKFLKNPIKYFYQSRLGAALASESPDNGAFDTLEADFLRWWQLRDEAVRNNLTTLEDPEFFIEAFRRTLELEAAISRSPVADFQAEEWKEKASAMQEQLTRIKKERFPIDGDFTCRLSDKADGKTAEGDFKILPAPEFSLGEGRNLKLLGDIGTVRILDNDVWCLVDFVSGKNVNAYHSLYSWLATLLLANALGEEKPKEIRVFRLGAHQFKARRYYFREEVTLPDADGEKILIKDPVALLQSVIDFFQQGQTMALPLYPELAEEIHKKKKKNSGTNFAEWFDTAWQSILNPGENNKYNYSRMRNCLWRERFLAIPDNRIIEEIERFWKALYDDGGLL